MERGELRGEQPRGDKRRGEGAAERRAKRRRSSREERSQIAFKQEGLSQEGIKDDGSNFPCPTFFSPCKLACRSANTTDTEQADWDENSPRTDGKGEGREREEYVYVNLNSMIHQVILLYAVPIVLPAMLPTTISRSQ
ncbi:unnamed protein product, partial [Pleuronectes platessa]